MKTIGPGFAEAGFSEADVVETDFLVIGSGISGLTFALAAAAEGRVAVVAKGGLHSGSTPLAQGGIAAALGADDGPELHAADTERCGAGLCEPASVRRIVESAQDALEFLENHGVAFDRDGGRLRMAREGAHSRNRVAHAGGDATGREIGQALARDALSKPNLEILDGLRAVDLEVEDGVCLGAFGLGPRGVPVHLRAAAVVLATGGLAGLYRRSTNGGEATGDGHAMAFRAGARLRDMEFVQFHPTALESIRRPLPLISEAVRGEGASIVDSRGRRFLRDVHPQAELAPRDVVAREIYLRVSAGEKVWLDARKLRGFRGRFPTIFRILREHGLDPALDLIPVTPAAHYTIGGVETDAAGRTSIRRLFAIGESASTGLHGANRLASNSLLEGASMGLAAARAAASSREDSERTGPGSPRAAARTRGPARLPEASGLPEPFREAAPPSQTGSFAPRPLLRAIQDLLWSRVGVVRTAQGLEYAVRRLETFSRAGALSPVDRDAAAAALLVARAALWREESLGAHYRADHPECKGPLLHSVQEASHESVVGSPVAATVAP